MGSAPWHAGALSPKHSGLYDATVTLLILHQEDDSPCWRVFLQSTETFTESSCLLLSPPQLDVDSVTAPSFSFTVSLYFQ